MYDNPWPYINAKNKANELAGKTYELKEEVSMYKAIVKKIFSNPKIKVNVKVMGLTEDETALLVREKLI